MAPNLEKPAKQMVEILWRASKGESPELFTGDPGGLSPNKRLMLAVIELPVKRAQRGCIGRTMLEVSSRY